MPITTLRFPANRRTCLSASSRFSSFSNGTSCTAWSASMAKHAAVAADWPRIMKTGSMRIEPKAMCVQDTETGTRRFSHSLFFGTKDP